MPLLYLDMAITGAVSSERSLEGKMRRDDQALGERLQVGCHVGEAACRQNHLPFFVNLPYKAGSERNLWRSNAKESGYLILRENLRASNVYPQALSGLSSKKFHQYGCTVTIMLLNFKLTSRSSQ